MNRRDFLRVFGLAGVGFFLGSCGRLNRDGLAARETNLVLIVSDTLRADHLGCYGSPLNLTPNIDALARRGLRFSNLISCASCTGASHATIFTGTRQDRHGVLGNTGPIEPSLTTLGEICRQAGYQTAAFVSNLILTRKAALGIEKGFAVYNDLLPRNERNRDSAYRSAEETVAAVREGLGEVRAPFFLWTHLMEPHGPYEIPNLAGLKTIAELPRLPGEPARLPVLKENSGPFGIPNYQRLGGARTPMFYRARYASRVAYMDHFVGELIRELESRKLLHNTLVIFTSDHGELLGEQNYYFQHTRVFQPVLRVPLILLGPGIEPGQEMEEQHSNVDILPTIVDLLQLNSPALEKQIQGKSLRPWGQRRADGDETNYAFYEADFEGAIFRGKYKLSMRRARRSPQRRLIDLQADPAEQQDLSARHPEVVAELQPSLDSFLAGIRVRSGKRNPASRQFSEQEKRQLKSLGYLK